MGQKVNPIGMRIGVNKDWSSRWFASKKDYSTFLMQDQLIRDYLKSHIDREAGVSHIDIERKKSDTKNNVYVMVFCARPGFVIGEKGANTIKFSKYLEKKIKNSKVKVDAMIVQNPDLDAKIVSQNIATQLEQRASFRIAQKRAITQSRKAGAQGIKTNVSGRLGGAEIAREEGYKEGIMAINTLKTDIDYAVSEAHTTYGKLGVKVWISRGTKDFGLFSEESSIKAATKKDDNNKEDKKGE